MELFGLKMTITNVKVDVEKLMVGIIWLMVEWYEGCIVYVSFGSGFDKNKTICY